MRRFQRILTIDKQTLDDIGQFLVDLITTETQGRGRSLVTRGPLAPLKQSYIDYRRGAVAFFTDENDIVHPIPNPSRRPRLSGKTSPGRSNLTFTSQMIDSLNFKTNVQKQQVRVAPTGRMNRQKAQWAHEGAPGRRKRPFIPQNRLPKRAIDEISKMVKKSFRRRGGR